MTNFGYDKARPRHLGPYLRISPVIMAHLCGKHPDPDPRCVACVTRAQHAGDFPTIVRSDLAVWYAERQWA